MKALEHILHLFLFLLFTFLNQDFSSPMLWAFGVGYFLLKAGVVLFLIGHLAAFLASGLIVKNASIYYQMSSGGKITLQWESLIETYSFCLYELICCPS